MDIETRCLNVIVEIGEALEKYNCGIGISEDNSLVVYPNEDNTIGILVEPDNKKSLN